MTSVELKTRTSNSFLGEKKIKKVGRWAMSCGEEEEEAAGDRGQEGRGEKQSGGGAE